MECRKALILGLINLVLVFTSTGYAQLKHPSITVHVYQGPCGKPIKIDEAKFNSDGTLPSDAIKEVEGEKLNPFVGKSFASLYFVISVNPPIEITYQGKGKTKQNLDDYEFRGLKKDLEWMKVFLKITDKNGKDIGGVRVVRLAPEETDEVIQGENKGQQLGDLSKQFGSFVAPFMPKAAGETTKIITDFAGILFKNLIKPRLVTYQYAFLNDSTEFGWYWKRKDFKKKDSDNLVSLLGVKRGIALIQVEENAVTELFIKYRTVAKWSEDIGKEVDDESLSSNLDIEDGEIFKKGRDFFDFDVKLLEAVGGQNINVSSCRIEGETKPKSKPTL